MASTVYNNDNNNLIHLVILIIGRRKFRRQKFRRRKFRRISKSRNFVVRNFVLLIRINSVHENQLIKTLIGQWYIFSPTGELLTGALQFKLVPGRIFAFLSENYQTILIVFALSVETTL